MTNAHREDDTLSRSLKLLALTALSSLPFKRQIWLMSKAGFPPTEIAAMLDTTPNIVNARLSEMRKAVRKTAKSEATK